jgi:hypothetical protein
MQTIRLADAAAMSNAITGSSVSFRPISGYVSTVVIEVKQTSATNPTGSCTIEIQGSIDGVDWVTLYSLSTAVLTKPLGVTPDFGAGNGGYRSNAQVIQALPLMRACTSAALVNGANAALTVILGNG